MAAATASKQLCSKPIVSFDEQDLIVLDETGSEDEGQETDVDSPTPSIEDGVIVIADHSSEEELKIEKSADPPQPSNECKCSNCGYKKEIDCLQKEVVTLKTKLQLLESQKSSTMAAEEEAPVVRLLFASEDLARKYKTQAEQFIREIMKSHLDTSSVSSDEEDVHASSSQTEHNRAMFPEGFIDNVGIAPGTSAIQKPVVQLPTYRKEFNEALSDKVNKDENSDITCVGNKKVCFHCKGDGHMVSHCPKLKGKAVNGERRMWKSSPHRYHNITDSPGKFNHFKPGQLSDKLRSALGLGKNDLPHHIYEMRHWGYPPGWLEDARKQSSGLTMYNSEDKGGEDSNKGVRFDVDKIIEYPGFNVRVEEGYTYKNRQMPMHRCNFKDNFINHLQNIMLMGPENRNKRKNETLQRSGKRAKVQQGEADMEIEDDDDDVVAIDTEVEDGEVLETPNGGSSPCQPEVASQYYQSCSQSNGNENVVRTPSTNRPSPSLEDLESKKQELMQLLDDNFVGSSSSVEGTPTGTPAIMSQSTPTGTPVITSQSLSVQPGTPVFSGKNPFKVLPDVRKFSQGISEYAPFENLPNTTGQYEKIRLALKGVRAVKE